MYLVYNEGHRATQGTTPVSKVVQNTMKLLSARVLAVVAVLSLIGNVLMYLRYSSNRPLATVGGSVITKKEYQDQLEHQAGPAVLNKMVFERLIRQAAAKAGVSPTAKDVDARIAELERRAPTLLTPYQQDKTRMSEFRQDLWNTLALESLRVQEVKVTPSEAVAYYQAHKTDFALPQQVKSILVVSSSSIDAATAADLLRQKTPLDVIARQPRLHVVGVNGYSANVQTLPLNQRTQISNFCRRAKIGDVRTFPVNSPQGRAYLTFQVVTASQAVTPPLPQIQSQVTRLVQLKRAPSELEELARLYQAAKPVFSSERYAAYFDAVSHAPQGAAEKTAAGGP